MEGDGDVSERLRALRAFGAFRRALRAASEIESAATQTVRFVTTSLGASRCAVLFAERDDADFRVLADSDAAAPPDGLVPRTSALVAGFDAASKPAEVRAGGEAIGWGGGLAVPCVQGERVVALVLLAGGAVDAETLDELAFEVGAALSTASIARMRAEELAVLEVQERELVSLLRDVQERDAIIRTDLEEARAFQHLMLGAAPEVPGVAIELLYRPLDLVGGDLYSLSFEDGVLRVFIADATGHGVRASLTTMFIKSGYEAVKTQAQNPGSLLESLNDAIAGTYASAEMLFSAACLDLDLATGTAHFASAGHPPLCVVRGATAEAIGGGEALLGLRRHMKFTSTELRVEKTDGLYLLTDGLTEARAPHGEIFGEERLHLAIAAAHAAGETAAAAAMAAVETFTGTTKLSDDATLVGIRFR
jgi:sigma-B regulation protein RsbU (phosphoserine phosphatase)